MNIFHSFSYFHIFITTWVRGDENDRRGRVRCSPKRSEGGSLDIYKYRISSERK